MRHLIIVRHGNTFRPGETPTRVGARTDPPLVESERARGAGRILRSLGLIPDRTFAAPLKRTLQTAELILEELGLNSTVLPAPDFTEIDYGPDENRTEDQVRLRLGRHYLEQEGMDADRLPEERLRQRGEEALELWNAQAIPPYGWQLDPAAIAAAWRTFSGNVASGENVLLVSSNGIIRFAFHLLPEAEQTRFRKERNLKVSTGGVCVFARDGGDWRCLHWNLKPGPA